MACRAAVRFQRRRPLLRVLLRADLRQRHDGDGGAGRAVPQLASPSWSYDAGDNQKIIVHELFHTIEFAHDHIPPSLPPGSGPGLRAGVVGREARRWSAMSSPASGNSSPATQPSSRQSIEQTKQSDVPLDQLQNLSQTQQPGVWDVLWVAVHHLATTTGGLHTLIDYLDDLGASMTWPDAFQDAFGMTITDYCSNFAAYRAKL